MSVRGYFKFSSIIVPANLELDILNDIVVTCKELGGSTMLQDHAFVSNYWFSNHFKSGVGVWVFNSPHSVELVSSAHASELFLGDRGTHHWSSWLTEQIQLKQ
jgi:hypothetical protein